MKEYAKELYDREVLLKTAFAFTDSMYLHLDSKDNYWLVSLCSKSNENEEVMYFKFENELIAQQTRLLVTKRTEKIRKVIVARALSSTIVNSFDELAKDNDIYNADDILKDWFEANE